MITLWLAGLIRRRPTRLAATALGIGIAVALMAELGGFLVDSEQTMTARAAQGVAVDWQVQVAPGGSAVTVAQQLRADHRNTTVLPVSFGDAAGLSAATGGTRQQTGAGRVLGLPPGYGTAFPGEMRLLAGATNGPLLVQQTAANLHAAPGDTVTVDLGGGKQHQLKVAGVVELPQADSLFQRVGSTAQLVAPPDNVVLLPAPEFAQAYAGQPTITQFHIARDHASLPHSPAAAYADDLGAANNLAARTAGAATVGSNLGAALGAAREDAAYARILFLFLAVPGALLAAGLTGSVVEAGAERRRSEQALLRARGASTGRLTALSLIEALVSGVVGVAAGLLIAWAAGSRPAMLWDSIAAAIGLGVACLVVARPAIRDARALSARPDQSRRSRPPWLGFGLDVALVAAGIGIYLLAGQNKYTLVLAPEGVPTVTASYWAFLGPMLAWLGLGLLCWRLADAALRHGRGLVTRVARPALGSLAPAAASMLAHRRRGVARATVLLALALAYAISTSTFNATYQQQAEVDAQLTNGADIAANTSPGAQTPPTYAATLAKVSGVHHVQPMLHRFAYVGSDLQDMYGIDPTTLPSATHLQDSYFQGITAAEAMNLLRSHPDGALVSAETVNDYQLNPGDLLRLRIQDARTHQFRQVPFHYIGVVNEFPTAPKDSFIVTNTTYLAQQSHSDAVGSFLIDTGGRSIAATAGQVRRVVGTQGQVATLLDARGQVGSSLTSVDLGRLTRLELSFALVIAALSGGLVLGLGLAERRRGLAVATALGASPRQVRRLFGAEPAFVFLIGAAGGILSGAVLAELTVKVLTGVFDPPPTSLAFPWLYLVAVVAGAGAAVWMATRLVVTRTQNQARDLLRSLG
ncbi:ABC transporter permease [Nocardioides sp. CER19]|uniref:FtsX-like permease family protein n=1 Tax=Nocardioides sp. CER19 TaxID=3038538 RepID=UPI00244B254E|nr:ABC transporter permease [Nocardioides sp. CER19]MDH2415930.1 FtsX-like permease family protein [Nocardioides sp. CER19]